LIEKPQDNTMIVNTEVDTLIESNLGTMIINDTDDDDNEDAAAEENSETMKRQFLFFICFCCIVYCAVSSESTSLMTRICEVLSKSCKLFTA